MTPRSKVHRSASDDDERRGARRPPQTSPRPSSGTLVGVPLNMVGNWDESRKRAGLFLRKVVCYGRLAPPERALSGDREQERALRRVASSLLSWRRPPAFLVVPDDERLADADYVSRPGHRRRHRDGSYSRAAGSRSSGVGS